MQVPPTIVPIVKGPEKTDSGGLALTGASESGANPNKRHAPSTLRQLDGVEEEKAKETLTSRLIDQSPISSETQAALLSLLSEPFAGSEGSDSFAELVEEATIEQSAALKHPESDSADEEPEVIDTEHDE